MIKTEDIPDSVAENLNDSIVYESSTKQVIAAILNTAIEAGLVSPPVWALRDRQGRLIKQGAAFMAFTTNDESQLPLSGDAFEHYRGQTE